MPVFLAHDGSLNGDWIAHYALHLAAGSVDRRLTVLHVEDANISGEPLHQRLERVSGLGERIGVTVETEILPMHGGVFGGLDDYLPKGPETLLVSGARVSGGRRGLLSGTISERLLRFGHYNVLAIHVLQPGLLGDPRRVLLTLSDPGSALRAMPFLLPLAPAIEHLDILHLAMVSRFRFSNLSAADAARLYHAAQSVAESAANEIAASIPLSTDRIDSHVRVSDDWAKQTAVEAGRYRAGLTMAEMPSLKSTGLSFGHPIEQLMRIAPSDVAVYREAEA
ncbi:MAG: hypothetical protein JJ900_10745 [Rhodospirillales bacterium]|nr:hypothetical protein [Rhodospirillales bacterium]MBO6787317.1 hypothetical protein [Rhodospirillales bacterium]